MPDPRPPCPSSTGGGPPAGPNLHRTVGATSDPTLDWHARAAETVLQELKATPAGLPAEEAARRLAQYGRNALPAAKGKSPLHRFLLQFHNLLIYILIASAVVTAILGHTVDTVVIVAVVLINALIGFVQEGRAEQALAAIQGMLRPKASVLRNGRRVTVDASQVVPGDVLLLEAGNRIAADVRVFKARNLRIDEAILTGESVPVEKTTQPVPNGAPLGDRRSMGYSGTLVTAGLGAGVVVATGSTSELGRISALLKHVQQLETPLIRQMNKFARQLTITVLALAVLTFAFAVWLRDYSVPDAFMIMVGMAVAAIPEGLPAVMTITLAIGVQRMAKRNAIIRRLPAVETLGAVSIISSDKTGTLTRNEMTVSRVVLAEQTYAVGGIGYLPKGGFSLDSQDVDPITNPGLMRLARSALLCNDANLQEGSNGWAVEGDPMEGALITLGLKAGYNHEKLTKDFPRLDEIPFDAAYRYMATLHHDHQGRVFACVKGAPERIFEMCHSQAVGAGEQPIQSDFWENAIVRLAAEGHRVLAIAFRPMPPDTRELTFHDVEHGLTLEGAVGLIDPPRAEAIAAVAECHRAGIVVKMITGDHAATASAIAAKLGLDRPNAVTTGPELDLLDDAALRKVATATSVFARTSPEHKLRLVQALQADGSVVAMTGDGVNDAPALKRADVGIAMGHNGTEAAKEAAEMVLADDNFASIVAAVREGRTVYDNLTKVIGWTLPTNGGEMIIIVAAILFGLTLPITPAQILWINMVTAVGLGLVLAFEPAEGDVMQRPPRPADTPLLSGFLLWQVVLVSVLFAVGAFGVFAWAEGRGASQDLARTLVVNAVVVMEIFYLFSVRYLRMTSLTWQSAFGTAPVIIGVGSIIALQVAFTYVPLMHIFFHSQPLTLLESAVVIGIGMALFVILEIEKRLRRYLFKQD